MSKLAQIYARRRIKRLGITGFLILLSLLIITPASASLAQPAISASQDHAGIQFPNSITFSVELQSQAEIQQVSLEYRVQQVTCGKVIAIAFPEFTPGKAVTAIWTWEMKQSGSLPPGAKIYWAWKVVDSAGNSLTTPEQSITWLDSTYAWQTLTAKNVNLHWYEGDETFGQELLDSAESSLANLEQTTGLKPESPIDVYIYANTDDLRQAILYEPGWTGGQAFAEHDIVIIGIAAGQIDWGKGAIAHELTHVLVGHLTFTCLGYIPGWLTEGLAMYGEGGPDDFSKAAFEQAVSDDKLVSVQALSGGFSENSDQANISYSESYSLVNFLITEFGKDPMMALLEALKQGATVDGALKEVYGFDINGLEDAWRAAIGAKARQATTETAQATPTATLVPTIAPISGVAAGPTLAPTRVRRTEEPAPPTATLPPTPTLQAAATRAAPEATSQPFPTAAPDPKGSSPSWISGGLRILTGGGFLCLILVGAGVAFFFAVIRPPRRRRTA